MLERVMGIEPTSAAWKAEVLPLNYTRLVCENYLASCRTFPALSSLTVNQDIDALYQARKKF
jgi:hypothetical protein